MRRHKQWQYEQSHTSAGPSSPGLMPVHEEQQQQELQQQELQQQQPADALTHPQQQSRPERSAGSLSSGLAVALDLRPVQASSSAAAAPSTPEELLATEHRIQRSNALAEVGLRQYMVNVRVGDDMV